MCICIYILYAYMYAYIYTCIYQKIRQHMNCVAIVIYVNMTMSCLIVPYMCSLLYPLLWTKKKNTKKYNENKPFGCSGVSTLRPRQNSRHFPDDIFKCILLNENCIFIKNVIEICSQGSNLQYPSIASDNGLLLVRRQAIIWINDGLSSSL